MLLLANSAITKWCKNSEKWLNPVTWVLIWEYSARAIQWIPTQQGLDGFVEKNSCPCALDQSSFSIERVKEVLFSNWKRSISNAPWYCSYIVLCHTVQLLNRFLLSEYFNMKNIHMTINLTKPRLSNWLRYTWTLLRIQVLYWKCTSSTTTTCCHFASYYANSSH